MDRNVSLKDYNTFGLDVRARLFWEYRTHGELRAMAEKLYGTKCPYLFVGRGSNLLFTGDYDGVILHSGITSCEIASEDDSQVILRVGSGVIWDDLVAYAVEQGWSGIENLSLIPGEVGAAAVQNIGAYGSEAKDVIVSVETVDMLTSHERTFSNAECKYAYRQSAFKNELKGRYGVTYVNIRLSKHFNPNTAYGNIRQALEGKEITPATVRQAVIDIRNAKLPDPKVMGNAGSFFMNPVVTDEKFQELKALYPDMPSYPMDGGVKIPAGWLIEQTGWKGKSLGNAAVHDKQALVIVNKGGATAEEIIRLCHTLQDAVKEKFGVEIKPEVNFI